MDSFKEKMAVIAMIILTNFYATILIAVVAIACIELSELYFSFFKSKCRSQFFVPVTHHHSICFHLITCLFPSEVYKQSGIFFTHKADGMTCNACVCRVDEMQFNAPSSFCVAPPSEWLPASAHAMRAYLLHSLLGKTLPSLLQNVGKHCSEK